MKIQYKSFNFRDDSLARIELANNIIKSYQAQGLRLTLRQLYYQFVTRNAIPNQEKSYDSLGKLISDARLAGLVDWEAIEDRVRVPRLPAEFADIKELMDVALSSYRFTPVEKSKSLHRVTGRKGRSIRCPGSAGNKISRHINGQSRLQLAECHV